VLSLSPLSRHSRDKGATSASLLWLMSSSLTSSSSSVYRSEAKRVPFAAPSPPAPVAPAAPAS
jgi:hypothetical protein